MYDIISVKNLFPEKYQGMLSEISNYYPVIAKATKNYNKTQSQYMNNMMTLSQPTEIRSLRQILAEINSSKQALDEAYFKILKKKNKLKRLKRELQKLDIDTNTNTYDLDSELINIKISELESQIKTTLDYVEGAIRRVSSYMAQYKNILKYLKKEEVTEKDFEEDEERYHIMKAFEQGLCAARSHGGIIDEGNHIYFYQIGINGAVAQKEVFMKLKSEGEILSSNNDAHISGVETLEWMRQMADKFKGCSLDLAASKHLELLDENSLNDI